MGSSPAKGPLRPHRGVPGVFKRARALGPGTAPQPCRASPGLGPPGLTESLVRGSAAAAEWKRTASGAEREGRGRGRVHPTPATPIGSGARGAAARRAGGDSGRAWGGARPRGRGWGAPGAWQVEKLRPAWTGWASRVASSPQACEPQFPQLRSAPLGTGGSGRGSWLSSWRRLSPATRVLSMLTRVGERDPALSIHASPSPSIHHLGRPSPLSTPTLRFFPKRQWQISGCFGRRRFIGARTRSDWTWGH